MADRPPLSATAERTRMFAEAAEGGAAVARFLAANQARIEAIGARLRERPPMAVVTCGRGSSGHAGTYGKYLMETRLGIPTASAALSVASIYHAPVAVERSLCLAISQSGRSPDLIATAQAHKDAGGLVVAFVNEIDSPLAELADEAVPLMAGPERSVAATKSCVASLAALAALTAAWSADAELAAALAELPSQLDAAFGLDWSPALPLARDGRSLFVIGRGCGLGIAREAALKLKETCGLHAEAFSSAEVRHGPMAIVGKGFPILAFATSDVAGKDVRAVAEEFRARGADMHLADPQGGAGTLPALATHPALEPLLMIQSFYRYANALSVSRGFDPDTPPHLNKVTSTR